MGGVIRKYYTYITYMKLSKNNLILKVNTINPIEVRKSIYKVKKA